jgi:hypothetical protein
MTPAHCEILLGFVVFFGLNLFFGLPAIIAMWRDYRRLQAREEERKSP